MKRSPLSKSKRQWLTLLSLPILGTAMALPLAHAATSYVSVDGHSVPVSTENRTIHIPGGGIQIHSVTWGTQGVPGHLQVTAGQISPVQAEAMIHHSLWQMRSMQVAMDRQIAEMNQLMRVSFGPFASPFFNFPEPVMMTRVFLPGPVIVPLAAPAHLVAPSPAKNLPGHELMSVRWRHPQQPASPKLPI